MGKLQQQWGEPEIDPCLGVAKKHSAGAVQQRRSSSLFGRLGWCSGRRSRGEGGSGSGSWEPGREKAPVVYSSGPAAAANVAVQCSV